MTAAELAARAKLELTNRAIEQASVDSTRAFALAIAGCARRALDDAATNIAAAIAPALPAALALALRPDPDSLVGLPAAAAELRLTPVGLKASIEEGRIALPLLKKGHLWFTKRSDLDALMRPLEPEVADPLVRELAAAIAAALPAARAPRDLLTVREAAAQLQVSTFAIWRWVAESNIRVLRLGRTLRLRRADLDRMGPELVAVNGKLRKKPRAERIAVSDGGAFLDDGAALDAIERTE